MQAEELPLTKRGGFNRGRVYLPFSLTIKIDELKNWAYRMLQIVWIAEHIANHN